MSGLDVASGIAGLVALSLQVSGTIAQYISAVKGHSKDVSELHNELSLLANVLSRLDEFLRVERAEDRVFEEDSILFQAITDCSQRVERIGDKLRPPGGSKLARTFDKLRWPFEQTDVYRLVDSLRSEFLSQTWQVASESLQNLQKKVDQACETNKLLGEPIEVLLERSGQLQRVIEILPTLLQQSEELKEVSQTVRLAEQREQERRKSEILDWLIPLSTLHKHVDLQNRRARGSCAWVLENEMFKEWVVSDDPQHDMLCQGGPGVGKTMLCSMVADHLRTRFKNEETAVAYYYFDITEQQVQTEYSLAKSVLRQLCQSFRFLPAAVTDFYQRTRNELQDSLWLQELQSVLQSVVATFSRCYIIIDALDETDPKRRNMLLKILSDLKASSIPVKFFATTRPHVVLESFSNALKIEVRADEGDLRTFLSHKIDTHPYSTDFIDAELKEVILDKLCLHADGVFLLPALQIEQILDQAISRGDVERSIAALSTDLKEVFRSTVARIESFSGAKRNLSFKTLMWLSHARRPLRISELQHAIAVRLDVGAPDIKDIPSIGIIVDSCCGLVELDGETASVRFVHGSIAEYLRSQDHGFFKDANLEIVRVCLKYLTTEKLKDLADKRRSDLLRAVEFYPFLEYASSFWGLHARDLEVKRYQDLALPFLNSSNYILVAARARDVQSPDLRNWRETMRTWSSSGGAGISVAASFGLAELMSVLICQSSTPVLDARNMLGSTALHECAVYGYQDTADVLVAHGADLLDSNQGRATPFYLAVSYRQLEMCKHLLSYDRGQLDIVCKDGNTALHKASDLGSECMVGFLLESGATIDLPNHHGMTPLHLASRRGHHKVIEILISKGADIHSVDKASLSPLDYAAIGGHLNSAAYLLQQGANVNQHGRDSWKPLHRAARSGHTQVVNLLLSAGANVVANDRTRSLPFHLAVRSGNLDVIKAILYHDPALTMQQLKHRDRKNNAAIEIAFYTAQYHVYEFLRDLESEFIESKSSTSDIDVLLPLTHAIEKGSFLEVRHLIENNPRLLDLKDGFNQTPLHTAFRTRQWSIAAHLLSAGAPINSRGYHGWTPLHIAASLGDMKMVQLALDWNADVHLQSDSLQTVLHKAVSSRNAAVLLELLRCGCDPAECNDKGMNAIHVAACVNFLEGLLIMISADCGGRRLLFARDKSGRTPRDWATRAGYLELLSVLKDEEHRARGQPVTEELSGGPQRPLSRSVSDLSRPRTSQFSSQHSAKVSSNSSTLVADCDSIRLEASDEVRGQGKMPTTVIREKT